jgi:hypothetical protein
VSTCLALSSIALNAAQVHAETGVLVITNYDGPTNQTLLNIGTHHNLEYNDREFTLVESGTFGDNDTPYSWYEYNFQEDAEVSNATRIANLCAVYAPGENLVLVDEFLEEKCGD